MEYGVRVNIECIKQKEHTYDCSSQNWIHHSPWYSWGPNSCTTCKGHCKFGRMFINLKLLVKSITSCTRRATQTTSSHEISPRSNSQRRRLGCFGAGRRDGRRHWDSWPTQGFTFLSSPETTATWWLHKPSIWKVCVKVEPVPNKNRWHMVGECVPGIWHRKRAEEFIQTNVHWSGFSSRPSVQPQKPRVQHPGKQKQSWNV